jgi:tetratricopeptide (TPR) repeat protein
MKSLLAACLLLTSTAAVASAATLFHDGRFIEAAGAGRAEGTTASLVLAGRATLIVASFDTSDRERAKTLVDQADHDFDAALQLAPDNLDAQLQKATSVGYRAKLSKSPGLGKETRSRMEAVLARDPSNALAWASIGGWHAGAVATIGKFLAGTLLGANLRVAFADFDTALAKDPKNPATPAFYGLTLLDLGPENAPRALQVLQIATRNPARDAYEGLLKKAVVQVIPLLTAGDVKGAQTLARKLLPFGKLA